MTAGFLLGGVADRMRAGHANLNPLPPLLALQRRRALIRLWIGSNIDRSNLRFALPLTRGGNLLGSSCAGVN